MTFGDDQLNIVQGGGTASDHKNLSVVLDIESFNAQSSDRSSGSPKMTVSFA